LSNNISGSAVDLKLKLIFGGMLVHIIFLTWIVLILLVPNIFFYFLPSAELIFTVDNKLFTYLGDFCRQTV